MSQYPTLHPLDIPYDKQALFLLRDHLHNDVIRHLTSINRSDYLIVFDASREGVDIYYQAGRPIQICLCTSPYISNRVYELVRRAFSVGDDYLKKFLRFYSVTKRSEAVKWYGIEVSGDPVLQYLSERDAELKRYENFTETEYWIKVTVKDPETGRRISLKQLNGNAFDMRMECIRLLRSSI